MSYVKIDNDKIVKWPYTLRDLRADHPNVSFPADAGESIFAEYGATPVQATEKPLAEGKIAVEISPELVNGVPHQRWELRNHPSLFGFSVLPPGRISKLTVIERLDAAGLLAEAYVRLGPPGSVGYERWQASSSVDPNNKDVLDLLNAIGANKEEILAPE